MGWIILFAVSILLIFGFVALAFNVSKESDEEYGESGMTKNQIRALAWGAGILLCILAAIIEYFVVLRKDPEDENSSVPIVIIDNSDIC